MRLVRARVTNYKCVLDSEEFTLGGVTCLVGKNESGKTALLEAIEKLNSVRPERALFEGTDFPRMLGEVDAEHERVIAATFELDVGELAELVELVGSQNAVTGNEVTAYLGYDNHVSWKIPVDMSLATRGLVESSSLTAAERKVLERVTTTHELIQSLRGLADPSARQVAFLAELTERYPSGNLTAQAGALLAGWLPGFVYYSQYDRLPGRVSVDRMRALVQQSATETEAGAQVFMALMSMVGLDVHTFMTAEKWEPLLAKLESVSVSTSRKIFKYWSQNKNLNVRFAIHQGRPGDPAPYNTGTVFETRIENTRHGASIRLDERSAGFIWFFSFLVWFSEVQKTHGGSLVVLLDEPGLTLHAAAQGDLLRYIRDELLLKYQVVYTTHSPFMVDAHDITTARTVEDVTGDDNEVLGTKVGDRVLSADGDTLFPLRAALGYDISQTLFVGEHTLLVEGPSDLLYLRWASDELRKAGGTALDSRWTVTPCGGITKVPSFLALFGGNQLHVAVLTDHGRGDKKKVRELRESELMRAGHVFTADEYAETAGVSEGDTEDILGRRFYVDLVNVAYGLKGAQKLRAARPKGASVRVVAEVEDHFRQLPGNVDEYDHYTPASYLVTHADAVAGLAHDSALGRCEKLFTELNALL